MRAIARFVSGRGTAWIALGAAAVAIALLFALLPQGESDAYPPSGLPDSSDAKQVSALLEEFPDADTTAAIFVYSRGGDALTEADTAAITASAARLAELSLAPQAVVPQVSDDGTAALLAVPLDGAEYGPDSEGGIEQAATTLRDDANAGLPDGLEALLTGPIGFQADITNAFAGADFRLLLVTVIVVAVLLIVTYRSPVLWIVPLAVVGIADGLARVVVTSLADPLGITIDASIGGILSVLVFGAGTNYALLLVARYREELTRQESRNRAMLTAVTSAGPAIAASGGTVALSLLTLLFAELAGNRALGVACAIGVAIAILFALLVLPAALVVCGRGLFWPFVPRVHGAEGHHHAAAKPGFWTRLGEGVRRRPAVVAIVATLGIGVLAVGLTGYQVGLSQTDQLIGDPESVVAQRIVDDSFSAGLTGQTVILTPDAVVAEATTVAESVDGVESVRPGESANGLTRLDATLAAEPESDAAFATVEQLRADYAAAGGEVGETLVGGADATALDTNTAAANDQALIIPLILAIVFVILALLLRSLVAPVLLIASVLATFFASLGASNVIFQNLSGFPAFDSNVILFAFLFLVALGVDYNIFLTTRAREETVEHGTRAGMVRALSSTGGVITSAGILLAAVFAVLGVLPVVALTQIGVIVCIGVLLDTLVVRTVLVPALVFLTGDWFWWPSRPARNAVQDASRDGETGGATDGGGPAHARHSAAAR
ncbi:MMPL family transporter [Herbiconiux sp. CPCC 203407]|uniref:MMPL family transporter n=1 Tax=Herbiconiux oxytropis TaxID=2970915 RepID=A0AA41XF98_9MICO|nr:MMPL family transporter [Herbiconiux oxytropis]MCS5723165.1 MMPL family transporter [Herbiconiux oxytropis]MCS5725160.1 MMPL family transporter [Herbiconiux oxytropis]